MHCLPTATSTPSLWCACGRGCCKWWESDIQPYKEPIRYNKTHRIMGKMVYTRETTSFLSHLPFRASAATTLALYVVQQNLFFLQETLNFL